MLSKNTGRIVLEFRSSETDCFENCGGAISKKKCLKTAADLLSGKEMPKTGLRHSTNPENNKTQRFSTFRKVDFPLTDANR